MTKPKASKAILSVDQEDGAYQDVVDVKGEEVISEKDIPEADDQSFPTEQAPTVDPPQHKQPPKSQDIAPSFTPSNQKPVSSDATYADMFHDNPEKILIYHFRLIRIFCHLGLNGTCRKSLYICAERTHNWKNKFVM